MVSVIRGSPPKQCFSNAILSNYKPLSCDVHYERNLVRCFIFSPQITSQDFSLERTWKRKKMGNNIAGAQQKHLCLRQTPQDILSPNDDSFKRNSPTCFRNC